MLKLEQELARVRGEIEQAYGQLRYLQNKTSYSTVTVEIREQRDYVPPQAPSFGNRIALTWLSSLSSLRAAGEFVALVIVAIAPWLAVFSIPVLAVVVIGKKARRV